MAETIEEAVNYMRSYLSECRSIGTDRTLVGAVETILSDRDRLTAEVVRLTERYNMFCDESRHWNKEYHSQKRRAESAEAKLSALEEATSPFVNWSQDNVEADLTEVTRGVWSGNRCEGERIKDWFGPSDFYRLSLASPDHTVPAEEGPSPPAKIAAYEDAHATAVELGYPSLTEALEALSALPAEEGWRPIAEAPQTGVRIIATNPLWSEDRRVRVVWWVEHGPGHDEGQYWQDDADSEPDPALWQPLSGTALALPPEEGKAVIHHHKRHPWAQPGDEPNRWWILRFSDPDMREMVWSGEDAEQQAQEAYAKYCPAWNVYLFATIRLAQEPQDARRERYARIIDEVAFYETWKVGPIPGIADRRLVALAKADAILNSEGAGSSVNGKNPNLCNDPDAGMCAACDCWKFTRAMCS